MTLSLNQFLLQVREKYPGAEIKFSHPSLYVICVDEKFGGVSDEQQMSHLSMGLGMPLEDLSSLVRRTGLQLILTTSREKNIFDFLGDAPSKPHWIELFARRDLEVQGAPSVIPHVHFYGYKGGQARSTVLCMLARRLANDGYKVLVVDTDLEAPSLSQLFGPVDIGMGNSVMGCVMNASRPEPINVYARDDGIIDLLAARPSSSDYDLDFAVFVLNAQLDPSQLVGAFSPELSSNYDVVLVDHRSGIASSIVPIMVARPGPLVACMRLDDQSILGLPFYQKLLELSPDIPGLFVTFSLDPDSSLVELRSTHDGKIARALEVVAEVLSSKRSDPLDPLELFSYWVPWFYDRAFLGSLPQVERISKDNRDSIARIRELTGLATRKTPFPQAVESHHLSGASSEAAFIRTEKISQLFQHNTPYVYIFGRKGTGKTRLVEELLKESGNEPLLVARDVNAPIKANSAIIDQLGEVFSESPEKLWWTLLGAALSVDSVKDDAEGYAASVEQFALEFGKGMFDNIQPLKVAGMANALNKKRVFLIDSVETAFPPKQMHSFVASLFRFLATIQSDSKFASKVVVRLFLRADLASKHAGQNAEQHLGGKKIDLVWDAQSIFNFVLSRIASLKWFVDNFREPCRAIEARFDEVRAGLLSEEEYQPLLLRFFPEKLKGPNLASLYFLRTYFSDAAGDVEANAAFYPRLFEQFLNFIANPSEMPGGTLIPQKDANGFLNHALITRAHEEAARQYLGEVSQELEFLLELNEGAKEANDQAVKSLLSSFNGKRTPFNPDALAKELAEQNPKLQEAIIRKALDTMLSVGMFEKLQREKDRWRVGRLFKTALGMKFVRGS